MNNQIQVVLKSSTTEMSLNDHDSGIYIVPELNGLTGLPDIRTTSGVNAGYDGGWTSAQNYDARSITLRGVIANEDKASVERMRKQLVSLLGQGKNEELTLDIVTEAGSAYEIQVRTIACEMAMQRVLTQQEFMIQLRADDPLIYDNTEAGEPAIVQVQKALGGFQIPFEIPLAIGGGEDASVIDNHGLEQVAPIVKMYGALHNPKIINQTTNQYMQIEADLGYAEGAYTDAETSDSGQYISFDAPIAAPLSDFSLKGNTTQQTYTGKNLFNKNTATQYRYISDSNGSIATSTNNYTYAGESYIPCEPNTAYTLSGGSQYMRIAEYTSDKTFVKIVNSQTSSSPITITTGNTGAFLRVSYNDTSLGDANIQLEKGSATTYEPYVGGTASPNPDYPQAVQTVTGEQTIDICGKNMFDYTGYNQSYGGLTNTLNPDGTITTTGVPTGNYTRIVPNLNITDILEDGATYRLSKTYSASYVAVQVQGYRVGGGAHYYNDVFTVDKSTHTRYIITAQTTTTEGWGAESRTITCGYQLEKGSTATTFEPYRGQSYEVNLGKNLYSFNDVAWSSATTSQSWCFQNGATGAYGSNVTDKTDYKLTLPAGTYKISVVDRSTNVLTIQAVKDGSPNEVVINNPTDVTTSAPSTITLSETTTFCVRYRVTDPSLGIGNTKIQIEKGSTATTYAPYFTPIELCKIGTYQDYIWKDGDTWKIHKAIGKITLNGSETYTASGAAWWTGLSDAYAALNTDPDLATKAKEYEMSDYFSVMTLGELYSEGKTGTIILRISGQNTQRLILNISGYTKQQLVDWITANKPSFYYWLATATDTTITNATLIAQLEAILNSGSVYKGTNNITTVIAAGNAQGEVQVSYYTHQDPATRDEIIIDSRLRTITLNGLDIYDKKTDGSEFLMLAPGENKLMLQSDIDGDNGYAEVNYKQGYLSI